MDSLNRNSRQYRLINSDGHVTEPGDLWTTRVSSRFKERAALSAALAITLMMAERVAMLDQSFLNQSLARST